MSPLDQDRVTARLPGAVESMAAAVAAAPRDAAVPGCPGWDVTALVEHLVTVHRWVSAVVLTGARQAEPAVVAPPDDLAGWYTRAAEALLAALRAVEPEQPAWNFTGADQRVTFWWRRQLHEVTVHTVDVRLAAGVSPDDTTVDPDVAADGVDEVVAVWPRRMHARHRPVLVEGPVAVHATDTGRSWRLLPADPYPHVERDVDPEGADALVAGPAAALYLRLWGRAGEDALVVRGPAARAWLDGPRVP